MAALHFSIDFLCFGPVCSETTYCYPPGTGVKELTFSSRFNKTKRVRIFTAAKPFALLFEDLFEGSVSLKAGRVISKIKL